jgi:preprotein translocase subunit SecG
MNTTLAIIHTIVTILLILSILSQNRSSGLSATFGGTGEFYVEKRGAEKILYNATIVLAVLFVGLALLAIFI